MKFGLIGIVFIATASLATPASAQEAITNPGRCALFYPNANCQNYGPGNPYRSNDTYVSRSGNWYGSNARMRHHSRHMHRNETHKRMH